MNLINKKINKNQCKEDNILLEQDLNSKKYFITNDDFLNISLLKINFIGFNTYVKNEEKKENAIWEFEKIIIIQFLKDKTNYCKNFIIE
jgi:hypothetical protein